MTMKERLTIHEQIERENARKLKELGSDAAFISQVTGLTIEQIEAL